MEVAPVVIVAPILVLTYRNFPLTPIAYLLIGIHAVVLMVGGHYTYAEMPLFNWLRDNFHLARNYYDRLGHLMQGAVPAIVAREILLRASPLRRGRWLFFITTCICMAISAWYELVEWLAAVFMGQAADAFLGTQGDAWDTQWDMAMCFIGCLFAQLALGKLHDRQIERVAGI